MEQTNLANQPENRSKADLIKRLDIAVELATNIRKQWERVGELLDETHRLPLAA